MSTGHSMKGSPVQSAVKSAGSADMKQQRRRLSVMSDNKLVEGFENSVSLDEAAEVAAPAQAEGFIVNSYGGYSKKGYAPYNPKKKNQDTLIMAEDPKTRSLLFVVMDGHGEDGDKVSQGIKANFTQYLFKHKDFECDIQAALTDVVARCEGEILRDASVETDFSGTTFTCAVIRDNHCTLCNIGDSRTSIAFRSATGGVTAVALTADHKPDLPLEKARIEAKGGRVFAVEYDDGVDGPARVWLGHMDVPGLAMSRSLCDAVAHTAGVSSEPEFVEYEFNPEREDLILVMASDGLWEFMSDQEVMDLAYSTTEPRFAVDRLISESNERWMREEQVIDDTTVCVAFLGKFQASAGTSTGK
ncbi:phosphatase 2C-like domain-containing protein [Ochromonadaceae sp. CCMP2298]|nr:phosphatase 2C-like domain-containing protein [Ochromonadaceae sp. CCMP2298]